MTNPLKTDPISCVVTNNSSEKDNTKPENLEWEQNSFFSQFQNLFEWDPSKKTVENSIIDDEIDKLCDKVVDNHPYALDLLITLCLRKGYLGVKVEDCLYDLYCEINPKREGLDKEIEKSVLELFKNHDNYNQNIIQELNECIKLNFIRGFGSETVEQKEKITKKITEDKISSPNPNSLFLERNLFTFERMIEVEEVLRMFFNFKELYKRNYNQFFFESEKVENEGWLRTAQLAYSGDSEVYLYSDNKNKHYMCGLIRKCPQTQELDSMILNSFSRSREDDNVIEHKIRKVKNGIENFKFYDLNFARGTNNCGPFTFITMQWVLEELEKNPRITNKRLMEKVIQKRDEFRNFHNVTVDRLIKVIRKKMLGSSELAMGRRWSYGLSDFS